MAILLPVRAEAQRITFEPAVEISGVHDDNLFYSAERPESDFIQRIRPTLELRMDSPRWSATGAYEIDSDRYADHSALTDNRAREEASLMIEHRTTPRLTIAFDARYIDTARPADLNLETGLLGTRTRVRRVSAQASGRFRISPRVLARGRGFSTIDDLSDDRSMRVDIQEFGIERTMSSRDLLTVTYGQSFYTFDDQGVITDTNSYVVKGGWRRSLTPRTELQAEAGPRVSDGDVSPEWSVTLNHDWRYSSIAVTAGQTETTAVGHIGTLQSRGVTATLEFAPTRDVSVFAAPGVHRHRQREAEATVYRVGLGIRYAATPLVALHATYNHDRQRGILDPLGPDGDLSRSTLFVGVEARWTAIERIR